MPWACEDGQIIEAYMAHILMGDEKCETRFLGSYNRKTELDSPLLAYMLAARAYVITRESFIDTER
jgi:hypothetical protein